MDSKSENIDQYIDGFPTEVQQRLLLIRTTVKKIVPKAVEKISYGIPTFTLNKVLIHFGGFKKHIGIYALPETNASLDAELKKYKTGKGSIQFPHNEDLPIGLIEKLVKFRVKEIENNSTQ